jgi:hypothetical protein
MSELAQEHQPDGACAAADTLHVDVVVSEAIRTVANPNDQKTATTVTGSPSVVRGADANMSGDAAASATETISLNMERLDNLTRDAKKMMGELEKTAQDVLSMVKEVKAVGNTIVEERVHV